MIEQNFLFVQARDLTDVCKKQKSMNSVWKNYTLKIIVI